MLDRFGQKITVGWSPTEHEYLHAANTLAGAERTAAFEDIAAMTGRSLSSVRERAYSLAREQRAMVAKAEELAARVKYNALKESKSRAESKKVVVAPSAIQIDRKRLTAGR